jgi:hypothetical protein
VNRNAVTEKCRVHGFNDLGLEAVVEGPPKFRRIFLSLELAAGKKQHRSHYDSFGEAFQRRYYGDQWVHMNRLHGHYDKK